MASHAGQPAVTVAERVAAGTPQFTFLQAMWLLHRAYPGAVPPGYQGPANDELVRLRPSASLAFPPGDLESLEQRDTRPAFQLTTTFMGLYGAHSPLPSSYSEEILKRCGDNENHTLRSFLDLFNHRLLTLLYRGLIKYRGHLLFQPGAGDEFSWRIFALSGLAPEGVTESTGLPAQRLLRFAGLLSQRPRSAASIRGVIATWFDGLPVDIQQCVPRWVYLGSELRSSLGRQACRLGDDATIGTRVRDWTGKFRIAIGPVDFATYEGFLPERDNLRVVGRLADAVSGDALAHDVEITIRGDETRHMAVALGRRGTLGWTAGLFSQPSADLPVVFA